MSELPEADHGKDAGGLQRLKTIRNEIFPFDVLHSISKYLATLRELFSSNSPNDKLHQFLWGSCAYCDLRKLRPLTLVVDSPD